MAVRFTPAPDAIHYKDNAGHHVDDGVINEVVYSKGNRQDRSRSVQFSIYDEVQLELINYSLSDVD